MLGPRRPPAQVVEPRVSLPPTAYAEQFALARRVEAARAAARLQNALSASRLEADATDTCLLDAFQQQLIAATGVIPVTNPTNGKLEGCVHPGV